MKRTDGGGIFIDVIQDWFRQRNRLWTAISFVTTLIFIIIMLMQVFFNILTEIDPQIRQGIYILMISLLALFVFSIFWRGSVLTFLSLAGALNLYIGMFYVFDYAGGLQTLPPHVANRLGYGTSVTAPPVSSVADFYLLIAILALILCIAIAFRPSLFKAKGSEVKLPYPIWTEENNPKLAVGANIISLIPVLSLLSFVERHLVAKYKYIQILIGGTVYFVSPDGWVPHSSYIIRDRESGSLLGIPKIPDGFNIW